MRLALHFFPAVQDDISGICVNAGTRTSNLTSSNGYYGYQPVSEENKTDDERGERMDVHNESCEMNMQFNNLIGIERRSHEELIRGRISRKRCWEYGGDVRDFKRRRENEKLTSKKKVANNEPVKENDCLLQELLLEIHGCNFYHWNGHEL